MSETKVMRVANNHIFPAESQTCFVVGISNCFTRHCPDDFTLHSIMLCGCKFWMCNSCEEGMHTLRRLFMRFSNLGISGSFTFGVGPLNENANLHGVSVLTRLLQNTRFVFFSAVPSPLPGIPFCQTGLHYLRFRNGDVDRRPHSINISEGKWSLLPDSLLWMIKDKLDIFDDMNLTAVCRDWRVASAGYLKQSAGDGMPWVMQWSDPIFTTVREFISVERNKRFTVDLPEIHSAKLLFSRQGWILLKQLTRSEKSRMVNSVVLVNPFTKATIKMPDLTEIRSCARFGCFTTHEGYPQCVVVLLVDNFYGELTVITAFPGDQVWTKHSYIPQRMKFQSTNGLLTVGQNIYCFDKKGNMIIYNMACQIWKELPSNRIPIRCHIVELEGRLLRLDRIDYRTYWYRVFRYNDTDTSWERLENGDMKDISWFVKEEGTCYAARKQGLKAYVLTENGDMKDMGWFTCYDAWKRKRGLEAYVQTEKRYKYDSRHYDSSVSRLSCRVHDLVDGRAEKLHLSYSLDDSATWVDIG